MLRVALTGGIGTGKSSVLARWRERGVPVVEADRLAHDVIAPGTPGAAAVRDRFGPGVIAPDGAVDRGRLGALVFADAGARRDLEAIVHPAVRAGIDRWMDQAARTGAPVAVAEIPLLFEAGREGEFDRVVVTVCDPDEQVRRVVARGSSPEDARRRISAQLSLDVKASRADYVIRTSGTLSETAARADEVYARLVADASGF